MQPELRNPVPAELTRHRGQPALLVEWPAGHRVFLDNLRDLFFPHEATQRDSSAAAAWLWKDVFVHRPVAWRAMASSALYHLFAVVAVYALSVTWAQRAPLPTRSPFDNSTITYYSVSEYLPPIDTGSAPAPAKEERQGEPKWARQRIISVPPAPDNFRQTIITPNPVKLPNDVPLPNLVAMTPVPSPVPEAAITSQPKIPAFTPDVVGPAPSAEGLRARTASPMQPEVVGPAPSTEALKSHSRLPNLPAPAIVEPPVSAGDIARPVGAMNMARLEPGTVTPKLAVPAQRAAASASAGNAGGQGAAPAAPDLAGVGNGGRAAGQLIALGLDPADVRGPINVPQGSRYGQFAATPEGHPNAAGTPDIKRGGSGAGGSGHGSNSAGAGGYGPPGITVGAGPSNPGPGAVAQEDPLEAIKAASKMPTKPVTVASLERPRMTDLGRSRAPAPSLDAPGKIEEKVFGGKRYYSMTLNMPNLTSAGGSWIMRFAELSDTPAPGEIVAPQAMVKVDPAYPSELIRDHVEGTVTLYAVIHKDGTVGEVKVLRGVDERLDESARVALLRWKFQPATKNGAAVDLQAVVQIPFVVRKMPF